MRGHEHMEDFFASATVPEQLMHELMRLTRLHFVMMQSLQEKLSIYPGQPQLLMHLAHRQRHGCPAPSQRELAQHLRIRPATLTVSLRRMESAGLLRRAPDPVDGRVQRVALTPQGEATATGFLREWTAMANELFASWEISGQEEALSNVARINRQLMETLHEKHKQEEPNR